MHAVCPSHVTKALLTCPPRDAPAHQTGQSQPSSVRTGTHVFGSRWAAAEMAQKGLSITDNTPRMPSTAVSTLGGSPVRPHTHTHTCVPVHHTAAATCTQAGLSSETLLQHLFAAPANTTSTQPTTQPTHLIPCHEGFERICCRAYDRAVLPARSGAVQQVLVHKHLTARLLC